MNSTKSIERLRQTRQNFLDLVNDHSLDQLNTIPNGYSNNMLWNFGHAIATQQLLIYGRAEVPFTVSEDLIDRYRKGTAPNGVCAQSELDQLKNLAIETVDQMEKDIVEGKFTHYKDYLTSYGIQLDTLEDALEFITVHEALHYGYAMAQRKSL